MITDTEPITARNKNSRCCSLKVSRFQPPCLNLGMNDAKHRVDQMRVSFTLECVENGLLKL